MNLFDLQYLTNLRRLPGRSALLNLLCQTYTASLTDPGGGATTMIITLPAPVIGFVRMWDFLACGWTAAAGDRLLLQMTTDTLSSVGLSLCECHFVTAPTGGNNRQYPVIGTILNLHSATPLGFMGIPSVIFGQRDIARVVAFYTAASGQILTLAGRYCDYPI